MLTLTDHLLHSLITYSNSGSLLLEGAGNLMENGYLSLPMEHGSWEPDWPQSKALSTQLSSSKVQAYRPDPQSPHEFLKTLSHRYPSELALELRPTNDDDDYNNNNKTQG